MAGDTKWTGLSGLENDPPGLFYGIAGDGDTTMKGDSVSWDIPIAGVAAADGEITTLYRELRQPLLTYLVCLGLSADDAQDVWVNANVIGSRQCGSRRQN